MGASNNYCEQVFEVQYNIAFHVAFVDLLLLGILRGLCAKWTTFRPEARTLDSDVVCFF